MPASFSFRRGGPRSGCRSASTPRNTVALLGRRLHAGRRPPASRSDARRMRTPRLRLFQSRIGARFPWQMPADWNTDVAAIPLHEALVGDVKTRFLIMLGGGRRRAGDRVRERREPQPVAGGVAAARDRHPNRPRRRAASNRAAAAHRERRSRVPWRDRRRAGCRGRLSILKVVLPPDTPRLMEAHVSWRALLFAGGLAIVTGCGFGLAPVRRLPALGWKGRSIPARAVPAAPSPHRCALR